MPLFGIDISHHQGSFDVERAAREGVEFFVFKATEGTGFTDSRFAENVAKARRTRKPFAAYHYQRPGSAAAQVAHISRVVPRDVPVIPDVEAGSGPVSLTRDLVRRLRDAGYRVPLLYLPRWYWQQIGRPSLAGLPPLWSSRYPDNRVGSLVDEYRDVPGHYWNGYGGLPVAVLQFTSSARVAGRSPIDGNAYRGDRAELAALFTGEEDDMFDDSDRRTLNYIKAVLGRYPTAAVNGKVVDGRWTGDVAEHVRLLHRKIDGLTDLVAKAHGVTAVDIARALRAGLVSDLTPVLGDVMRDALGADNADQADEIAERVLDGLATRLTETEATA